jgi:hypothetical protein
MARVGELDERERREIDQPLYAQYPRRASPHSRDYTYHASTASRPLAGMRNCCVSFDIGHDARSAPTFATRARQRPANRRLPAMLLRPRWRPSCPPAGSVWVESGLAVDDGRAILARYPMWSFPPREGRVASRLLRLRRGLQALTHSTELFC